MTLESYLQQHYTPATAKAYQREIAIYWNNYKAADSAVYKDLIDYIGLLRSRYSKGATINRIVSSIKVYYDYLCSENIRSDNPAKSVKLKDKRSKDIQLQDLFSTEELEKLLDRKERYPQLTLRNKVLASLLIYQALTPQEMEALTTANINPAAGIIYIQPTPKTNSRTLQLKPGQVLLFYNYLNEARPQLLDSSNSEQLLIGIRGEAMPAADITKHIKRSFKGVYPNRKVNAQIIRQSVIANLLKSGHDISLVQAFAGHKYPSTTERYRQSGIEALQSAVNRFHPLQ